MKHLLLSLVLTSVTAFSAQAANTCQSLAEKSAAAKNQSVHGAEGTACGSKVLHVGAYLESYLVCVSDETDPSEWIVVLEKSGPSRSVCKVKYLSVSDDDSHDFDQ